MTDEDNQVVELAELTADVVSAYVANNPLPVANLPYLIASVHASLSGLSSQIAPAAKEPVPAANPKKSVFPDYIISLEDGRKFQSMKRHLGLLGMTPDEYREKWGLSHDYPMVAPNYAAKRSALAKASGLGRKAEVKAPAKRAKKA
ncbi:MucR family transcriptional regulator [Mesorhizobium sp. M0586]|uniref:MucR family transcriptional regulator n=1 Tax=unclassified Mesorhizobium TaxID=325217 RepID=UPI00333D963A